MTKPRVKFCWYCGLKLFANHFKELFINGHSHIFHKSCAKDYQKEVKEKNQTVQICTYNQGDEKD